ncbi:hypothetical protein AB1283_00770 [Bacillus sp. S13(2024)]|uniref:hypothetical protein n=1 Tax=Bacillus sp. S13(2024) TaxID=3162885 RepID=UPI003D21E02E
MRNTWDEKLSDHIETPIEMINFFNDIEEVCKKHNMSISHEDYHGGFIIEEYNEKNIEWLKNASKQY